MSFRSVSVRECVNRYDEIFNNFPSVWRRRFFSHSPQFFDSFPVVPPSFTTHKFFRCRDQCFEIFQFFFPDILFRHVRPPPQSSRRSVRRTGVTSRKWVNSPPNQPSLPSWRPVDIRTRTTLFCRSVEDYIIMTVTCSWSRVDKKFKLKLFNQKNIAVNFRFYRIFTSIV